MGTDIPRDDLMTLMPFAQQLGIEVSAADADRAEARMSWAPSLCTAGGIMHGGALMSFADSIGALVAFLGLPEGVSTATITSTTQLFRPVSAGEVRAVWRRFCERKGSWTRPWSLYVLKRWGDSHARRMVEPAAVAAC